MPRTKRGADRPRRRRGSAMGSGRIWPLDGNAAGAPDGKEPAGSLEGDAHFVDSPFGKAVSLDGDGDSVVIPRQRCDERWRRRLHRRGLDSPAAAPKSRNRQSREHHSGRTAGIWTCPTTRAACGSKQPGRTTVQWDRLVAAGNRFAPMPGSMLRPLCGAGRRKRGSTSTATRWRRGQLVRRTWTTPKSNLHLGRIRSAQTFQGELDEVRIYRRALGEAEIQGLVQPGTAVCDSRLPKSLKT